jgi:hypothetical protein
MHADEVKLDVVESDRMKLLRVFHKKCVQVTCGYLVADINLPSVIQRILASSENQQLASDLAIQVDYAPNGLRIPLFTHSVEDKLRHEFSHEHSFDLLGRCFIVRTTAKTRLVRHLSSPAASWLLVLGLGLSLFLSLTVYNRNRFGERLRREVDERTQVVEDEREKLAAD